MDFLNGLWADAQALVAPLLALIKGLAGIIAKIFAWLAAFISNHI